MGGAGGAGPEGRGRAGEVGTWWERVVEVGALGMGGAGAKGLAKSNLGILREE